MTIQTISSTIMKKTSHKNDLPLTVEELEKLWDDMVAEVEAETPEERERWKKESALFNDPEFIVAVNSIKAKMEQYKTAENDRNEKVAVPRYWVPNDIPRHLQIALSIRGEQPESPADHFNRLEGLLTRLAHEWEEDCGEGSVLEAARDYAPDANLTYADSNAGPDAVMAMLMESDHLQLGWVHQIKSGSYDEGLQGACHEWGFVDRLSALVRLP